jgi:Family of unknown function (DUF6263)
MKNKRRGIDLLLNTALGIIFSINFLVFFISTASAENPTSVQLLWNWEKGKTFHFQLLDIRKSENSESFQAELNDKSTSELSLLLRIFINDVSVDGTAKATLAFEELKKSEIPNYESKSFKDVETLINKSLLKKNFYGEISKSGEVLRITGLDKIFDDIRLSIKSNPLAGPTIQNYKNMMGDNSLRVRLSQYLKVPINKRYHDK